MGLVSIGVAVRAALMPLILGIGCRVVGDGWRELPVRQMNLGVRAPIWV